MPTFEELARDDERTLVAFLLWGEPYGSSLALAGVAEHEFRDPRHTAIVRAVRHVESAGESGWSHPFAVLERLHETDQLGAAGGQDYVLGLFVGHGLPPGRKDLIVPGNFDFYSRRFRQNLERAEASRLASGILADNGRAIVMPEDLAEGARGIAAAAARMDRLMTPRGGLMDTCRELLQEWESGVALDPAVPTPIPALTSLLNGGFRPGRYYTVTAPTGGGKTAFAGQCALVAADWASRRPEERGCAVVYSFEMTAKELLERWTGTVAGVAGDYNRNRTGGGWAPGDRQAARGGLTRLMGLIEGGHLVVRDASQVRPEIPAIRADLEALAAERGRRRPGLVLVDYLGLLVVPGTSDPYHRVTHLTREIKLMAMELDVPMLVPAQVNRQSAGRDDKRPQLTDLRDSGSIEQDSNAVLALYMESYWLKDDDGRAAALERGAPAQIWVLKQRDGRANTKVSATFLGRRGLFVPDPAWIAPEGEEPHEAGLGLIEYPADMSLPVVPADVEERIRALRSGEAARGERDEAEDKRVLDAMRALSRQRPGPWNMAELAEALGLAPSTKLRQTAAWKAVERLRASFRIVVTEPAGRGGEWRFGLPAERDASPVAAPHVSSPAGGLDDLALGDQLFG
jgi:replicative DNA helicase